MMRRLAKLLALLTVALALGTAVPTAEAAVTARKVPKPALKNPARTQGKIRLTAAGNVTKPSASGVAGSTGHVTPRLTATPAHLTAIQSRPVSIMANVTK
jgi:hypothetical protein